MKGVLIGCVPDQVACKKKVRKVGMKPRFGRHIPGGGFLQIVPAEGDCAEPSRNPDNFFMALFTVHGK